MEAILSFVPPEKVVKFSAMTGQSLFYMADGSLRILSATRNGVSLYGRTIWILECIGLHYAIFNRLW